MAPTSGRSRPSPGGRSGKPALLVSAPPSESDAFLHLAQQFARSSPVGQAIHMRQGRALSAPSAR